jgi:hypothetical protein
MPQHSKVTLLPLEISKDTMMQPTYTASIFHTGDPSVMGVATPASYKALATLSSLEDH